MYSDCCSRTDIPAIVCQPLNVRVIIASGSGLLLYKGCCNWIGSPLSELIQTVSGAIRALSSHMMSFGSGIRETWTLWADTPPTISSPTKDTDTEESANRVRSVRNGRKKALVESAA